MKKKVLAVLLSACMVLGLAACGSKDTAADTQPAAEQPAEEEKTEAPADNAADAADTTEAATADSGSWGTTYPTKKSDFKIAFSNSYVGNAWRTAAINIFNAYCSNLKEEGFIGDYYSSSAGDDVQAQINEIRNMMSEGYDAIVCIAASATGLTSTLEEAAERGIVVVCFDANVESDLVYNVNTDQFRYGEQLGEFMAEQLGGKGNILWLKGIDGNAVTIARVEGVQSVLDKYPDIKVLGDGFTGWDEAKGAQVMSQLMSAYSDQGIDGIIDEGGSGDAIVQSLTEYGYDATKVPIAEGEMFNSFMKDWVEMDLNTWACAQPPYLSAAAVNVALAVLNGEKVDPFTYIAQPTCASKEEAEEKWYAPDQDGNWVCDWTDNDNSFKLTIEEILEASK